VCRKIAEQHGGTLVASNRARAGANFTMTFPLEQEAVRGKSDEVAG
jgi:signal transduction histidine kinase